MAKDYIQKDGVELPKKYCDHCGEYVERKCRNKSTCPNAKSDPAPAKIPGWLWVAIVITSIIIALLLAGQFKI